MGSFGEVRVGQYGNLPIAIKIIQFDGSEKEKLLIENEALLMSLCHHPSILQIYGISYPPPLDRRSTTAYLLLELGRLGSLWSYLCGVLSPSGVHHDVSFALSLAWISDIFSALSYLHQLKIIHRDVKAENVLLTLQMNCKLTDFGFAKQQLGSTSGSVTGSSSSLKGSFHFMAPEVKLTQKYSHRSDVDAGCVTAFQILSRSGPPIHDTRRNILLHASTFGPAISSFFNSCLQENPRDRISSAEASKLISEIQQTQNEPDPRHTSPGVPQSSPSRFKTAGKMPMDPQLSVPAAPPPPTAPPSELQLWIEDELSSYAGLCSFPSSAL
jgi:serine/threonine protein kinase